MIIAEMQLVSMRPSFLPPSFSPQASSVRGPSLAEASASLPEEGYAAPDVLPEEAFADAERTLERDGWPQAVPVPVSARAWVIPAWAEPPASWFQDGSGQAAPVRCEWVDASVVRALAAKRDDSAEPEPLDAHSQPAGLGGWPAYSRAQQAG